jgi:unsaturated rhamnogalacturonyl hydrolase
MKIKRILFFALILSLFTSIDVKAQIKVGLDNWFNNETNAKTGKPFHYLWNDSAFSGYSRFGKIFEKNGAVLSTLKKPTRSELSRINIYILVDPDTTTENPTPNYILKDDAKTIVKWVKKGGVLIILANDALNCEFTHLNQLAANFGMYFNHVTLHPVIGDKYEMGSFTSFPNHPLFKGVSKIFLKEISSIKIWGPAKPVLTEGPITLMAEAQIGKGFVFAVGDPWIYNEYIDHDILPASFDNRKAAENLVGFLMSKVAVKKK